MSVHFGSRVLSPYRVLFPMGNHSTTYISRKFLIGVFLTNINGHETKQIRTLIKFDTCGNIVIPNSRGAVGV